MTLRPLGLAQRRALQAIQRLTRPRGPQRSELAAELVVSDGRASRLMHSLRRRGLELALQPSGDVCDGCGTTVDVTPLDQLGSFCSHCRQPVEVE